MEFIKKRLNDIEDLLETPIGHTRVCINAARDYLDTFVEVLEDRDALDEAEYAGIRRGFNAMVISALVGAELVEKGDKWVLKGYKWLTSEEELEEILVLADSYARKVEAVYVAKAQNSEPNSTSALSGEPTSKKELLEIALSALEAPLTRENCLAINGMTKALRKRTQKTIVFVAGSCAAVLCCIAVAAIVGGAYEDGYEDGYVDGYIDGYCDDDYDSDYDYVDAV